MSKASDCIKLFEAGKTFFFFVNLDERGEFDADIRDGDGGKAKTVWEGDINVFKELIEDGFMKHKEDLDGLLDHLIDVKVLPRGADLKKAN